MAMITYKKIPECEDRNLVDEVFSWSLADVFNRNLYKDKVVEIPKTFSSVADYKKSFVYPLFEETHADLLSNILDVNRSPTAEIVRVEKLHNFQPSKPLLYTIYFEEKQGSYVPQFGDLIALTDVRPKCVDDLKRPNKSYIIALVQGMRIDKFNPLYKTQILSSKPINQQGVEGFPAISSSLIDVKRFAVFLTNLTTNIRIFQALRLELEGDKKKMIEKLLQVDSSVEESCAECLIDKPRDMDLLKIKEALKTFKLDSSQEAAILSCIAARECHHQNTVKLIWGPPGTGKTITVSSLLFMLLRMKCRTLTCAPTNIAVVGVTKRVMSLVRDSLVHDTYGLGDMVLFGNEERMKICDHKELSDIFLKFRVKILAYCLAPISGWNGSSEWMIQFLEDPEVQYQLYLTEKLVVEERCDDKSEDNLFTEIEDLRDSQVRKAMKGKNWKALIVNEYASQQTRPKKIFKNNILSFEQFVTKGFSFLGNHLISCIENLYTHMPTSLISAEAAEQMIGLVNSLRLFERLLEQTIVKISESTIL